jgi:hypothetical protein
METLLTADARHSCEDACYPCEDARYPCEDARVLQAKLQAKLRARPSLAAHALQAH